jgi:hypothetical protein
VFTREYHESVKSNPQPYTATIPLIKTLIPSSHLRLQFRQVFTTNIVYAFLTFLLSLAVYVAKNIDDFTTKSNIHSINTRHISSLYPPLLRLTKYQKGVYYTGIKIHNCLPLKIKELSGNMNHFKKALKIPFTWLLLY